MSRDPSVPGAPAAPAAAPAAAAAAAAAATASAAASAGSGPALRIDQRWFVIPEAWARRHPGGTDILNRMHGKDATDVFFSLHSAEAVRLLGLMAWTADPPASVQSQSPPPATPSEVESAFRRFRKQLEQEGWFERSFAWDCFYLLQVVLFCVCASLLSLYGRPYLCALSLSLGMIQAGWLGHDSVHARGRFFELQGRVILGVNAFSRSWWSHKHNGHHCFTNHVGLDVDIANEPVFYLAFPAHRPGMEDTRWRALQHVFFFPIVALLFVSWRIQSLQHSWAQRQWTELLTHACNYAWLAWIGIGPSLVAIYLAGLVVGVVVTASHQSEEMIEPAEVAAPIAGCAFDSSAAAAETASSAASLLGPAPLSFVELQFATTRDARCGDFVTEWLWGSMQYQLEHHLFPTLPKYKYAAMAKRVEQFARDTGLDYKCDPTQWQLIWRNIQTLRKFAGEPDKEGEAAPLKKKQGAGNAQVVPMSDSVTGLKAAECERSFTWQEVAAHNGSDSVFVSAGGSVYDVTRFLDRHPGGRHLLLLAAGRDVTDLLPSYHPFCLGKVEAILAPFRVGSLRSSEFPAFAPDSGMYAEMRSAVAKYFADNRLDPKSPWAGLWRTAMMIAAAGGCYSILNSGAAWSWPVRVVVAALFGALQALPLLHMMHDCSHFALSHSPWVWALLGRLTQEWYAGAYLTGWLTQHTLGHHLYTNVHGVDPDLPTTVEGDIRRVTPFQRWTRMYRVQHLYLLAAYGLLTFKIRAQDWTDTLWAQTSGALRVNPLSTFDLVASVCGKLIWLTWRVLVPLYVFSVPPLQFASLFLLSELCMAWYLAFNFQVSHISDHCSWPDADAAQPGGFVEQWAQQQIRGSVDYAHGSVMQTFLSGALNYQCVHHLFPGVSQYHYPQLAPIITRIAQKHGIQYQCLHSFGDALAQHVAYLKQMGQHTHKE